MLMGGGVSFLCCIFRFSSSSNGDKGRDLAKMQTKATIKLNFALLEHDVSGYRDHRYRYHSNLRVALTSPGCQCYHRAEIAAGDIGTSWPSLLWSDFSSAESRKSESAQMVKLFL